MRFPFTLTFWKKRDPLAWFQPAPFHISHIHIHKSYILPFSSRQVKNKEKVAWDELAKN